MRPPEAPPAPRGSALFGGGRRDSLRFELDVGLWRADAQRIAERVIADAACVADDEPGGGDTPSDGV